MNSTKAQNASPFAVVLKTEAKLLAREPGSLFWIVIFPSALLTILGLIPHFREVDEALGGRRVIDLYVPVAVLLSLIVGGLQVMPPVLAGYRERGILRRMRVTPVRPLALLAAQIIVHGAVALASTVLAIALGRIAFGVALPQQPVGYVAALLLTALASLAMGAAIASAARTTKATQAVGTAVFFPTMFSAGVWLPVQVMPDMLRRIVEATPFGAASAALDQAMLGDWPGLTSLGVMALWTVVLVGIAARWFRWE